MKIRTQLIVAFLLLAVLPMTIIVLVGYVSSLRAVREAVEQEASLLTAEMESRMQRVRGEMRERVERVGRLPFGRLAVAGESSEVDPVAERRYLFDNLVEELGESAALVESLEFVPAAPEAPAPEHVEPAAPGPLPRHAPKIVIEMHEVMREVERGLQGIESEAERQAAQQRAREGLAAAAAAMEMFARDAGALGAVDDAEKTAKIRFREEMAAAAREDAEIDAGGEEVIEATSVETDREFESFRVDFGDSLAIPVREKGEVIGEVYATVKGQELLRRVLARTRRTQGEVPFAVDAQGQLFTLSEEDRITIEGLPISSQTNGEQLHENWVVATTEMPSFGMSFGIARPIRESLEEIRLTALRNFGFGVGLIGVALLGVLPISRRMSSNVQQVTAAAEQVAEGDLSIRVPVRSKNEIGQLAVAFNSMASELATHQARLLEEERSRRDHEIERALLQTEIARKTEELEDARRFQLSLLPKRLPEHENFELAVEMRTATEVGGDYYDFQLADDGVLTAAIGDATGHGAKAGTMVTVIKSLFSAYPPGESLAGFLSEAGAAIRRMELGRMAMALALARLGEGRLTLAAAGMPPALLFRQRSGRVEEMQFAGMPLGSFGTEYRESTVEVAPGDTLLLMTDGLPELPNPAGEPLGYGRAAQAFEQCASGSPVEIVESLCRVAESWSAEEAPADDVTFVVARIRE